MRNVLRDDFFGVGDIIMIDGLLVKVVDINIDVIKLETLDVSEVPMETKVVRVAVTKAELAFPYR
ncbi:small-conductance mechanosensitive channel [Corchorus capsularis]|uniref:Small-conductance mechanosensitive channel n=1 Tax=Corchorus capsularis TaxID=210143 RepID=A0A1R3GQ72_COCAP|nr:small-conductance mechanosensitive channel [Corchorus capsularis]